jgi:hypothetical protein
VAELLYERQPPASSTARAASTPRAGTCRQSPEQQQLLLPESAQMEATEDDWEHSPAPALEFRIVSSASSHPRTDPRCFQTGLDYNGQVTSIARAGGRCSTAVARATERREPSSSIAGMTAATSGRTNVPTSAGAHIAWRTADLGCSRQQPRRHDEQGPFERCRQPHVEQAFNIRPPLIIIVAIVIVLLAPVRSSPKGHRAPAALTSTVVEECGELRRRASKNVRTTCVSATARPGTMDNRHDTYRGPRSCRTCPFSSRSRSIARTVVARWIRDVRGSPRPSHDRADNAIQSVALGDQSRWFPA